MELSVPRIINTQLIQIHLFLKYINSSPKAYIFHHFLLLQWRSVTHNSKMDTINNNIFLLGSWDSLCSILTHSCALFPFFSQSGEVG